MTNSRNDRFALLFYALALAASGCASTQTKHSSKTLMSGSRPSWVDSESPDFPRSRYVLGVGSADDEGAAADRARGEIARVFSADVIVNTSVEQSEQGDGKSSVFSSAVSDKVKTATAKILEGAEIVARWKDAATGRIYTLAVLDKAHALLITTEKAHELAGEASGYEAALSATKDPFSRAKAGAKLATIARAWSGLEADSRILGGGSLGADFDAAKARTQAAQALSALTVAVSASGDGMEPVETAVVSALNAIGLSAKKSTAGDLVATAAAKIETQDSGDVRWKRSHAAATVTLQDGRTGMIFRQFDVSAREDATTPEEARRRALASLAKKTAAQTSAAINDYFGNQ